MKPSAPAPTPDRLPLERAPSQAELPPDAVSALFGAGYTLRGTERVQLVARGAVVGTAAVRAGASLRLRLDAALLAARPSRVAGPRGHLAAPEPERLGRKLVLPPALLPAWGLRPGDRVTVAVGAVAFSDARVASGERAHVLIAESDAALAGVSPGDTAQWLRDVAEWAPSAAIGPTSSAPPKHRPAGRLVTENDVRQARLRGQRIRITADQLITPAARSLGRELGIFEQA